ncbi:hypothetical protein CEXT_161321 [Caerostris extrusa]|uniref:Uncharacterized protein n=1 Tax=Caerostris extrusa TaxID=172846 RepID=A0AAV4NXV9_CAEEX|nr:hypothetical protein CEXT_161321 [Caerostris extrusa]
MHTHRCACWKTRYERQKAKIERKEVKKNETSILLFRTRTEPTEPGAPIKRQRNCQSVATLEGLARKTPKLKPCGIDLMAIHRHVSIATQEAALPVYFTSCRSVRLNAVLFYTF